MGAFQRVFGATIFFGRDSTRGSAKVFHRARFNFFREARIWFNRDPGHEMPDHGENVIVLSDEFFATSGSATDRHGRVFATSPVSSSTGAVAGHDSRDLA